MANRVSLHPEPLPDDNQLGVYLKDRRTKLDAARFGYSTSRRRTPGLRREEVAQRAKVSTTWYTWLEQGRGGAPSADVLDRIARALALTDVEREHLFLLAQNRPPEVRYRKAPGVTPQLQRVLDSLETSPAFIKTPEWDIVAWNRAAAIVLTDYAKIPVEKRNLLRMILCEPHAREIPNWISVARFLVATFRTETAKSGATAHTRELVDELTARCPEFREMWLDHDVTTHGEGIKHLDHPILGLITLEYSAFAVDGKPDLGMVIYSATTEKEKRAIRELIDASPIASNLAVDGPSDAVS